MTIVTPPRFQPCHERDFSGKTMPSASFPSPPGQWAVIGSDTGVGKTRVMRLLAEGLRAAGRRVWLHKPVACGGWDGVTAEDARALGTVLGDGQPPATLCPWQFPEPASPHLAAAAAGRALALPELVAAVDRCRPTPDDPHDLLVEGIGGLLVPLTPDRRSIADLLVATRLPVVLVTRPHLGTLNHTALTVAEARRRGIPLVGLVLNHHAESDDGLAVRSAAHELVAYTGVPLLATLGYRPHTGAPDEAAALVASLLAAKVERGDEVGKAR
jgi:dethiobiotin synthetase